MDELKPCPFCGCAMLVESNLEWHRITGKHEETCVFDTPDAAITVPAEEEALSWAITAWNTRPREDAGVADEWRPIETAPRDGTKIIGCAIRQSGTPEHVGLYWVSHPTQKRWTDGEWSVFLTHWVPAPPALAAALGESNG